MLTPIQKVRGILPDLLPQLKWISDVPFVSNTIMATYYTFSGIDEANLPVTIVVNIDNGNIYFVNQEKEYSEIIVGEFNPYTLGIKRDY